MLCILYVNAIGALLAIIGMLVERARPTTAARRWVWCLVIPASLVLPGYYRSHHAAAVGDMNEALWSRVDALDPTINRVWFIMSALLVLWTVSNAGWVSHAVLTALSGRRGMGGPAVVDGVDVVVTESLGPATVGVLRTRVLLPKWVLALPSAQRRYVVRHEEEHRRAHDGQLLLIASLLLIVVPWNLALWWQLRRLSLAIEMDCDNRVVRALGDAPAYGNLLLTIAQAANNGPRLQPALLGGVGMLEQRLIRLVAPTPLRFAQRVALSLAIGTLLFVAVSTPHPVMASHVHMAAMSPAEHNR
ncbi:MAG: M56 family metallopeptidase [Gemmatimonadaceae bacterium]